MGILSFQLVHSLCLLFGNKTKYGGYWLTLVRNQTDCGPFWIQRLGIVVLGATDWGNPNDIGGLNHSLLWSPALHFPLCPGESQQPSSSPSSQCSRSKMKTKSYAPVTMPLGQKNPFLQANIKANESDCVKRLQNVGTDSGSDTSV